MSRDRRHSVGWWVPLVAAIGCAGCESSLRTPSLCQVEGIVSWHQQPLSDAWVVFIPLHPEIREGELMPIAFGKTDAAGKYRLRISSTAMGAWPGQYRVMISKHLADTGATEPTRGPHPSSAMGRNVLPACFNVHTTLIAEVLRQPQSNIDWPLDELAEKASP